MTSRALTPTIIICGAAAIAGGLALARPASFASTDAAAGTPAAVVATTAAAPSGAAGGAYGKKAPATTAAKGGAAKGGGNGAAAPTLTISDFAFGSPLTVAPGAKVPVRNRDGAPHTVTGSGFDSGTVGSGAAGTVTAPTKPGTYPFTCEIHPSMSGSLTVKS